MEAFTQPREFVGWWEIDFYFSGGKPVDLGDAIERIDADGRWEAYRDGVLIGSGYHEDFCDDPPGFTNTSDSGEEPQLVIYRLGPDTLEVSKAKASHGRPKSFHSPLASPVVHAALRRISSDDPRIQLIPR